MQYFFGNLKDRICRFFYIAYNWVVNKEARMVIKNANDLLNAEKEKIKGQIKSAIIEGKKELIPALKEEILNIKNETKDTIVDMIKSF